MFHVTVLLIQYKKSEIVQEGNYSFRLTVNHCLNSRAMYRIVLFCSLCMNEPEELGFEKPFSNFSETETNMI